MRERSDGQPMKIYCGTDLVEITRMQGILERQKDAFISRCFTEEEITYCEGKRTDTARAASFAARFAAKEAFGKAVGTGVLADGIGMKDIETVTDGAGAPSLRLHGAAKARAEELGITSVSVSLTHDGNMAGAVVAMLGSDPA